MCALSDVLQDVEDKLHHNGLVAPLAPPAVDDGDHHAIQSVEILSWEGLPVTPSHKSHLKLQNKPLITLNTVTPTSLCYKLYNYLCVTHVVGIFLFSFLKKENFTCLFYI